MATVSNSQTKSTDVQNALVQHRQPRLGKCAAPGGAGIDCARLWCACEAAAAATEVLVAEALSGSVAASQRPVEAAPASTGGGGQAAGRRAAAGQRSEVVAVVVVEVVEREVVAVVAVAVVVVAWGASCSCSCCWWCWYCWSWLGEEGEPQVSLGDESAEGGALRACSAALAKAEGACCCWAACCGPASGWGGTKMPCCWYRLRGRPSACATSTTRRSPSAAHSCSTSWDCEATGMPKPASPIW
ncbi:hypothetical protein TSOC_005684 [Tetrabaena socialis]|uniref:Uncharacterized protein n=1 Tax=Tetrabaena socialis TaxID=47790 RepID=A0A2J8A5M8_9CHLO|nr:hypothetical protein TSOC_005684 [Tetrabaena socialis]|eukprot:PNH07836.1 hypothetical protein TSOC_005684 [Tetrabaena socialis]